MKKIVLAVAFLGLIVAASYYRAVTHKKQVKTAYEQGRTESAQQVIEYGKRFDSLAYSVRQQELEAAESLWYREFAYRIGYDSLTAAIEQKNSNIDSLKSELQQLREQKETKQIGKKPAKHKASEHEQILSYYKKRYRALPGDLSPYEMKVALREIRDETAQKFSVSLRELNKIRKDNNLEY